MIQRHLRTAFPGTIHFVTTVTRARGSLFVRAEECNAMLRIFEQYRARGHIKCLGYVLMPDHFHALLYQEDEGPEDSHPDARFQAIHGAPLPPTGLSRRGALVYALR